MLNFFRSALLVTSSLLFVSAPALAAGQSLAEYKYVLHISDMDPSKQELILNNARNLLDAYPPGDVEVEIVAYGPGLRLMFAENVNAQMAGRTLNSFGLRAMSHAVRRPWLSAILPSRTALLRAPLLEHIVLEDWLLAQEVK